MLLFVDSPLLTLINKVQIIKLLTVLGILFNSLKNAGSYNSKNAPLGFCQTCQAFLAMSFLDLVFPTPLLLYKE